MQKWYFFSILKKLENFQIFFWKFEEFSDLFRKILGKFPDLNLQIFENSLLKMQ